MGTDGSPVIDGVGVARSGRSVVRQLRAGEWTRVSVTPLVIAAAASVLVDVATTYHVLTSPAFTERNVFLSVLAGLHPLVASGWQVGTASLFVLAAALSLGWLSTVAGTLAVCTNGLLGLNNLVLFITGTALASTVGLDVGVAVHVVTPLLGIATGLAVEWYRHSLPWLEACAGSALYLAAEIAPVFVL